LLLEADVRLISNSHPGRGNGVIVRGNADGRGSARSVAAQNARMRGFLGKPGAAGGFTRRIGDAWIVDLTRAPRRIACALKREETLVMLHLIAGY
jgi:hypothetical protein